MISICKDLAEATHHLLRLYGSFFFSLGLQQQLAHINVKVKGVRVCVDWWLGWFGGVGVCRWIFIPTFMHDNH